MMPRRTPSAIALLALATLAIRPTAAQVKSWKEIAYRPLPQLEIAKPEVYKLKNGVTVFLMEDHELPLIEISAIVRTGSLWEPAGKVGLADLMGTVQRTGGTSRMTGDEIDDFLAARAATIETSVDRDSGQASMSCLKGDFDDVFRVFAEILREPAFSQDKLDLAKVQASADIARRNDNVMQILSREFPRLVYGKESPPGRIEEYATIAAVTRDDLVEWHRKYYVPGSVLIGLAGDFDSKEMKKKIQAAFGDWKGSPAVPLPPVPYRKEPAAGVYFIEKPDVNQAYVAMGHLGIEMKNPDYFAVEVMNEVLGGGFASRMFSNVRSKKGLAYNVFGSLGAGDAVPGLLRAGLQTKAASMAQGVEAVKTELQGIIQNPPDEAELKRAKDSILNSFVFNYDSRAKILRQQMFYAYHGLPADFLETYRSNIEKVTGADVARVAKQYVKPDRLALLVIGKSADFDRPVSTFGKVETVDITIPAPPDTTPRAARTSDTLAAGRRILARAAAALGGRDPEDVRAIETTGKMVLSVAGQAATVPRSALLVFPDRMRVATTSPKGENVVVLAGEEGFLSAGGRVRPLPPEAVKARQAEMVRIVYYLARYASDPKMEAVTAGEEDVDGTRCEVIAVSYKGSDTRLWVAPDGRVLKQAHPGTNPATRAPGQLELFYSDYRDHEGRMVPHTQVMKADGQEIMTITVDTYVTNPTFDEALFKMPAS